MNRKDRAITDRGAMESILRKAGVCRLALSVEDRPYIVPLSFGYASGTLYFHSARKGKKLDMLRRNDRVCFEVDVDHEIIRSEQASEWSMKYRSVIGFGRASVIDDPGEKRRAYRILMAQYTDRRFTFPDTCVDGSVIIKVEIEGMTGKQSGY